MLLLLLAPSCLSTFLLTLLTQALIYAILAMSLDIMLGYTGLASLGHAAYFGLGAYSVGILATAYGAGFWPRWWSAVVARWRCGRVRAHRLRATGVYFLMITLALGMVVWGLAHRWVSMTQGDNGISGVPRPDLACRGRSTAPLPFYYFALAAASLAFAAARDRALAVRADAGRHPRERVAHAHARLQRVAAQVHRLRHRRGLRRLRRRVLGLLQRLRQPGRRELATSVEMLLMVALGGRGTLIGPALGAAVIVFLKNLVSVYTQRWLLILGAVYIGVIVYAPKASWARPTDSALRPWRTRELRRLASQELDRDPAHPVLVARHRWPAPPAQSKGPIKIGFLAPLTGGAAQIGKDMVNGSEMYLDEIGHQIAGRKVEVIVEDTQGSRPPR